MKRSEERKVIRLMKADPPIGQSSLDDLARQFVYTAKQELEVEVDLADARVVVARHFKIS